MPAPACMTEAIAAYWKQSDPTHTADEHDRELARMVWDALIYSGEIVWRIPPPRTRTGAAWIAYRQNMSDQEGYESGAFIPCLPA